MPEMVDALSGIRGSHGVVLKAQDEPEVAEAVDHLVAVGVPVVTYATDVPSSARCAYVGIDNHGAGVTAAYLVNQWLGAAPSDVLITLSRTVFRGEGEREVGFRSGLRGSGRAIVEVSDSDRHRRGERTARPGCTRAQSGHRCGVLAGGRQHRDRRGGFRTAGAGSVTCSSPTTSTPTTDGCSVTAVSRSCCTTTCAPTPDRRSDPSCSGTARCPPNPSGRRPFRS